MSPEPVVAGSPFTVSVTASDNSIISTLDIEIRPPYRLEPASDPPYPYVSCDGGPFTPQPVVTREFTCTLPAVVPNGEWRVDVWATDDELPGFGVREQSTFHLIGGSEDRDDPVLESVVVSPDPVVVGQPFSVTIRASDEHPGPTVPTSLTLQNIVDPENPSPRVEWPCGEVAPTEVSPTVREWAFTGCVIGPDAVLGSYSGFMLAEDAIGHRLAVHPHFDVVAPEGRITWRTSSKTSTHLESNRTTS